MRTPFTLLLIATFTAHAFAWSTELPPTEIGRWVGEFFSAYASDEESASDEFVAGHFSAAYREAHPELSGLLAAVKPQLGALEIVEVIEGGPRGIVVKTKAAAASGAVFKWTFAQDATPPHDMTTLSVLPDQAAPARPPTEHEDWADITELTELVREDCGAPALAVCVIKDGEEFGRAVVGVRQHDGDDAALIDDRFHWGSITKSITATVIGRLVEDGALSLDQTLGELLDDIDMRDEYRDVTLGQVLAHRGGIAGHPETGDFEGDDMAAGRLVSARSVLSMTPLCAPGAEMHYSNAGFTIAGIIAERAGGAPWEDLVRRDVFARLAFERADLGWPANADRPDQPRGHFGVAPNLTVQDLARDSIGFDLDLFLAPAGNAHGAIAELAQYGLAHLRGLNGEKNNLLSAETIQALHTPVAEDDGMRKYAGGWVIQPMRGEPTHWHNGSTGSFYALVTLFPESNLVVAIATNIGTSGEPYAQALVRSVHTRLVLDAD